MRYCTQCGTRIEGRRTCSGCGTVIAVEPPPAPPLAAAGARYPLYADAVSDTAARGPLAVSPQPDSLSAPIAPARGRRRRPVPRLLLVLGCVLLAGVVGGGLWLTLRPSGTPSHTALPDVRPPAQTGYGDLTGSAAVSAPATDEPGVDTAGHPTSYDADNMLDGDAGTAWRMAGDGAGTVLTFRFPETVTLTEVGLVNGYAKTGQEGDRELDWYRGNRRILAVDWTFDDGTTIHQDLRETRDLQTVPVAGLATRTVQLRLVEVSEPGAGPARRDKTSISEVSLVGR